MLHYDEGDLRSLLVLLAILVLLVIWALFGIDSAAGALDTIVELMG